MLMRIVILVAGLLGLAVDLHRYRRMRRQGRGCGALRLAAWALSDALPFIIVVLLLAASRFGRNLSAAGLWMVWVWMITALPRMLRYLLSLGGLPRTGTAAALLLATLLLWGATSGRTRLRVTRVEVGTPHLPRAFDGLRIVHFSDLHLGTMLCPEQELRQLVGRINRLRPDIVCFTGDLVNSRPEELDARAMRLLGAIEAPVYAVTGNHDTGIYAGMEGEPALRGCLARIFDSMRRMGWHPLDDESVLLRRDGAAISLTGLSFDPALIEQRHSRRLPAPDLRGLRGDRPDSLFDIALIHLPQLWEPLRRAGRGRLTLSGHVHAMQLKVALGGWSWSPAAWLYPRWSGRYDCEGSTLYINDGIGCVGFPMRLGAAPEITLITLRRCE